MRTFRCSLALVSILLAWPALAEERALDPASKKALDQTQQMMTNSFERQKALEADPRAKAVDAQARAVVGEENASAVYALAADIMGSLTTEAGGDPAKMLELLAEAQKNPELLEKKLTPEQRAQLKAIAKRVPAATATPPSGGAGLK